MEVSTDNPITNWRPFAVGLEDAHKVFKAACDNGRKTDAAVEAEAKILEDVKRYIGTIHSGYSLNDFNYFLTVKHDL